jgi:hypothetical protein
MIFYNTGIQRRVASFLNNIEKKSYTATAVYYLVCVFALSMQMCRGRDCGTCGGGYCMDKPELSLSNYPKTAALYFEHKKSRDGGSAWRCATAITDFHNMVNDIRREMDGGSIHELADIHEIYPAATQHAFDVADKQDTWEYFREKLWS